MNIHELYRTGTLVLLQQNKLYGDEAFEVGGYKFFGSKDLLSGTFDDAAVLGPNVPIKNGGSFLEIGTGPGAVGITAVLRGAQRAVLTDINPESNAIVSKNAAFHGISERIEIRIGDLFSVLKTGEKFDTGYWNCPWYPGAPHEGLHLLEKAVCDPGYTLTERYIKDILIWCNEAYLGFSSTLGDLGLLNEIAKKHGRNLEIIWSSDANEVHPVQMEIIKII